MGALPAPSGARSSPPAPGGRAAPRVQLVGCGRTDVGRQRGHNEDHFLVHPHCEVFAVFDGMGGNNAGEVASALGTTSLRNFFEATQDAPTPSDGDPGLPAAARRLVMGVRKANADIFEISSTHLEHRGMGSTVVALHICREAAVAHIAHVGDSRCYRIRGGAIQQLTRDHSLISDALAWNPNLTEQELARLPRNIISRALGLRRSVEIDARAEQLRPGDVFLLCSDGLSGMINERQILDAVLLSDDLEETCDTLIALANEAGGSDNITALAVRVEDTGEGAFSGPEISAPPVDTRELEFYRRSGPDETTKRTRLIRCPACGYIASSSETFCLQCGARVP
jgi:PPM family protein phosphatase